MRQFEGLTNASKACILLIKLPCVATMQFINQHYMGAPGQEVSSVAQSFVCVTSCYRLLVGNTFPYNLAPTSVRHTVLPPR